MKRKFAQRPNAWKSTHEEKMRKFKEENPEKYAEFVKMGIVKKDEN